MSDQNRKDNIVTTVVLNREVYTKFKLLVTYQGTNIKHTIAKLMETYVEDNSHLLDKMSK